MTMRLAGAVMLGTRGSLDIPTFRGFGQFSLYILTLGKQAERAGSQQRIGVTEQLLQRREGSRGHDINRLAKSRDDVFDATLVHNRRARR